MVRIADRLVKTSFWVIIVFISDRRSRKSEELVFPRHTESPTSFPFLLGIQFSTCVEHLLCTEHCTHC